MLWSSFFGGRGGWEGSGDFEYFVEFCCCVNFEYFGEFCSHCCFVLELLFLLCWVLCCFSFVLRPDFYFIFIFNEH